MVQQEPLVLIVEDDPESRDGYAEFLERGGFRVAQAASAEDALEQSRAVVPDVIVTDIALPGRDGFALAALRVFLPRLTGWNAARRDAAARYAELGLGDLVDLPPDDPGHVYHMYVVRSEQRAEIAGALTAAGIASASYYGTPLHLQPALAYLGWERGSLPETERAAAENLALPMWGGIGPDEQERVVETVRSALGVPA